MTDEIEHDEGDEPGTSSFEAVLSEEELIAAGRPKAEGEPVNTLSVESYFLVYQDTDGHWTASNDFDFAETVIKLGSDHKLLVGARKAGLHDMFHAAGDIIKDVEGYESARRVMFEMQQEAQRFAVNQQTQQIIQQMQNKGVVGKNGLVIPGGGTPAGMPGRQQRRHPGQ